MTRIALGILAPLSWIVAAIVSLLAGRAGKLSLTTLAVAYFFSAFVTRLAIDHHESRIQIGAFVTAAGALELAKSQGSKTLKGSMAFWIAASAGAAVGVVLARPIAHRLWLGPW